MSTVRANRYEDLAGNLIFDSEGFDVNTAQVTSSTGTQTVPEALDSRSPLAAQSETYRIPSDFSTIQGAITDLSRFTLTNGATIRLLIESGHIVSEQIILEDFDASRFLIESEDPEVIVKRSALTVSPGTGGFPFISGVRSKLPIIGCLFSMDESGPPDDRDGIRATQGSTCFVLSGCGVKNSGGSGCNLRENSFGNLRGSIFTGGAKDGGTNSNGINLSSSFANCRGADVSDCSSAQGFRATEGSVANCFQLKSHNSGRSGLRVSLTSMVFARSCDIANSGGQGLEVSESSSCDAAGSSIINSENNNVRAQLSCKVSVRDSILTGAGFNGCLAIDSSEIDANNCDVSNAGNDGLRSENNSGISASAANASNCVIGAHAVRGSSIQGRGIVASNCGRGARIEFGSNFSVDNFSCEGYSRHGVLVEASSASLRGSNLTRDGSNRTSDIVASAGSTIRASDSSGGTNIPINSVSSSGLIFKDV